MHFNLIQWLFTDPFTAATNGGLTVPEEPFHFYVPWLIFCSLGVLITFYYSVEGRRRFFKNKPIIKYMLDRYIGWFSVICVLGYPIIFARAYLDAYFFAWRFWRYLWLAALVVWAITWIVYLVRKYPKERADFKAYQNRQQYVPKSKRKVASSR
jgi:formate-dependent nitrite reductase membrane component NrfD